VSIHKVEDGVYKIRWREGGRNRSLNVHGSHELATKIQRKKLSARDENRHLDVKKEVNFRMTALIDQYREQYGKKKKSWDREKSILEHIRKEFGSRFVREIDGSAINGWYQGLTEGKGLAPGTAVRHFNVMHHMMAKATTVWSKDTGIDRNPADAVELRRPDDQRERYLDAEEIGRLKVALDQKMYRKGGKGINQTFFRLRLIVLTALTTGMRIAEVFSLTWRDLNYREELIAVRARFGTFRCLRNWPPSSGSSQPFLGRSASFLLCREPSAIARGWIGVSIPSWSWPGSRSFAFTISGTRSRAGT